MLRISFNCILLCSVLSDIKLKDCFILIIQEKQYIHINIYSYIIPLDVSNTSAIRKL